MYNCYCDLPIWDWFKKQPKSYFEGIIREGGLVDARSEAKMTTRDGEWKLHHTPCNTSEKLVLREVTRHYIESVAKSKVVRIEVVNHLGVVKKFGVTEFMNSVKNMTINIMDEIILVREDGLTTGYQSHSIRQFGDRSYAKHSHRLIVEWWGKALRKHYEERDQFWNKCKTLEEFYAEYPKEVWGDSDDNSWFFSLGR